MIRLHAGEMRKEAARQVGPSVCSMYAASECQSDWCRSNGRFDRAAVPLTRRQSTMLCSQSHHDGAESQTSIAWKFNTKSDLRSYTSRDPSIPIRISRLREEATIRLLSRRGGNGLVL